MGTIAEDAIAAARAKADAAVNEQVVEGKVETLTAEQSASNAVSTRLVPAQKMTRSDLGGDRLTADYYAKIKFEGILMGEGSKTFLEEVTATIDLRDGKGIIFMETVKFGNPVQYESTCDRQVSRSGKSWPNVLAQAKQLSPNAAPYPTAEICFVLLENHGVAKAGDKVGITLPTTNWAEFTNFYDDMVRQGLHTSTVKVKLKHKPRKTPKGEWGIWLFELVDVVESRAVV